MILLRNWKLGRGWAGLVTIGFLFAFKAVRELMNQLEYEGYYYEHKGLAIAVCIAGLLFTAVVGTRVNRPRTSFDPVTRRTTTTPGGWHTVLGLPVQYWSVGIVLLMLVDLAH